MSEVMSEGRVEVMLLRHGIAEERRADLPDAQRRLTDRGRQRTLAVMHRFAALGLRADRMLSSPLTRALQTAELALEAKLAPSLDGTEVLLAPGADPLPLLQDFRRGVSGTGQARLLLVGHEPDLGSLCCHLLAAPPGAIRLRKAGLAVLDLRGWMDPGDPAASPERLGGAELELLLAPRVLLR
jgi:phosphohistidine phosphatase